jgi:nucleoid DNA-binding protein/cell division protein FtsN
MTKKEFIRKLAEASGITKKEAAALFNAVFEHAAATIETEREFTLPGIGTFRIERREGRTIINQFTKQQQFVPPSNTVGFTPSGAVASAVNEAYRQLKSVEVGVAEQTGVMTEQSFFQQKQEEQKKSQPERKKILPKTHEEGIRKNDIDYDEIFEEVVQSVKTPASPIVEESVEAKDELSLGIVEPVVAAFETPKMPEPVSEAIEESVNAEETKSHAVIAEEKGTPAFNFGGETEIPVVELPKTEMKPERVLEEFEEEIEKVPASIYDDDVEEENGESNKWLWVIVGLVILLVAGGFFLLERLGYFKPSQQTTVALDTTKTQQSIASNTNTIQTDTANKRIIATADTAQRITAKKDTSQQLARIDTPRQKPPSVVEERQRKRERRKRDEAAYAIQVSSWRSRDDAQRQASRFEERGFPTYVETANIESRGGRWYRVRIGEFATTEEAERARDTLKLAFGSRGWIVRVQ